MTGCVVPHARMTRMALRSSASSASPLAPPKASPCVLDLLGDARPRTHATTQPVI